MVRRLAVLASILASVGALAQPTAQRQSALVEFIRQDCGSCHGLTLKGGLGPALEPRALAEKEAEFLQFVILHGRPGTAMPPWRTLLTESEARWIAETLKKGLPQ